MNARILASSVLAALTLGTAVPAFAADSATGELEALMAQLNDLTCEGKEGRAVGQCISDVLKRIRTIEQNFALWYKDEVKQWRNEHDGDGISTEYTLALKAFNEQMQEKRKHFQEEVRLVRKAFFDQQTIVRVQKGEVNTTGSRELNTEGEKSALQNCSEKFASDQDAERTCLRNLLRFKSAVDKRLAPIRAQIEENEKNVIERPLRARKPLR